MKKKMSLHFLNENKIVETMYYSFNKKIEIENRDFRENNRDFIFWPYRTTLLSVTFDIIHMFCVSVLSVCMQSVQ